MFLCVINVVVYIFCLLSEERKIWYVHYIQTYFWYVVTSEGLEVMMVMVVVV